MGLARSTYYYRSRQVSMDAKKAEADLRDRIEQIVVEFVRYGYRRVTYQLRREGWEVNHKRVARMMREQSLQCQIKRRWVKTTDSDHGYRVYPNLLKGLEVSRRNQVWVADITYIRILTGFLYLAVVLDLFSRRVIGWALSEQIDAELTLAGLRMALGERGAVNGCIHHSDRGVQYACHAYVKELEAAGIRISMARKGNPYDNAVEIGRLIGDMVFEFENGVQIVIPKERVLATVEGGVIGGKISKTVSGFLTAASAYTAGGQPQ